MKEVSKMSRRLMLATLAGSTLVAAAGPAPAAIVHPDDEKLLDLGLRLAELDTRVRAADAKLEVPYDTSIRSRIEKAYEAEIDEAVEAGSQIIEQIEATPAHSLHGLKVKAQAIAWCQGEDKIAISHGDSTRDLRIANSLINELLALT